MSKFNPKGLGKNQKALLDMLVSTYKASPPKPGVLGDPLRILVMKLSDSPSRSDLNLLESLEKRGILRVHDVVDRTIILSITQDAADYF